MQLQFAGVESVDSARPRRRRRRPRPHQDHTSIAPSLAPNRRYNNTSMPSTASAAPARPRGLVIPPPAVHRRQLRQPPDPLHVQHPRELLLPRRLPRPVPLHRAAGPVVGLGRCGGEAVLAQVRHRRRFRRAGGGREVLPVGVGAVRLLRTVQVILPRKPAVHLPARADEVRRRATPRLLAGRGLEERVAPGVRVKWVRPFALPVPVPLPFPIALARFPVRRHIDLPRRGPIPPLHRHRFAHGLRISPARGRIPPRRRIPPHVRRRRRRPRRRRGLPRVGRHARGGVPREDCGATLAGCGRAGVFARCRGEIALVGRFARQG
ncbi:hypothetical protein DFJ74DRAFT_694751 [Hyaloraphidium curvatum]|nr:hypothetical protein DFJ74DRAFT_694751 [Hyaloraphidium curvatum]